MVLWFLDLELGVRFVVDCLFFVCWRFVCVVGCLVAGKMQEK